MPLYEYQCEACGNRFERIQKFSDPPVETCPNCEGAVKKLLSSPAIQFKGSGWYITDYARKGKDGEKSGSTASGGSNNGSDGAKSSTASPSSSDSTSGGTAASSSGS